MRRVVWLLPVLVWACTSGTSPTPTGGETSTSVAGPSTTLAPTTSAPSTTAPSDDDVTLAVGSLVPVSSFDPANAFTLGDWELLNAIGDGLLVLEPGDGTLVAGIAEDLPEVSDDGRTYTFRLRPDVEFADGLRLTATMYVDGIERARELGGEGSDLVSLYVDRVEAPDESTIVFHLSDDYAFFPVLLTGAPYLPVHPDAYPADQLQQFPEPPIYGVGPWFVESYSSEEIVLSRNPNYVRESPGVDRIVIRFYETLEEMTSALVDGDLDIIWRGVDETTADAVSQVQGVSIEATPGGTLHFLVVNHRLEPTDDPLVRRALAELIDRRAIVDSVFGGAVEPMYSAVPPGFLGTSEAFLDVFGEPEVSQAVDLLIEAGYTAESPALIELAYPPDRFGVEMAPAMEEVERQIESTGLVEVTLTAQPWNTYVGDVVAGNYNLAFLGWLYDFPDPHNYLAPFTLDGGLGGSGENLGSGELVDLIVEAATEHDETERGSLYQRIQLLYAEEVVTLPLWLDHEYIAYWDHVTADQGREHPETLNVGPTQLLNYTTIRLGGESS